MINCLMVALGGKNTPLDPKLTLFPKTGLCGGFTTFFTFSLEAADLFKSGAAVTAVVYVTASAALGVLAVFLGEAVMK